MKISYNWIKDYLPHDLPSEKLSVVLTDIGLEVEGVHQVESIKGGLRGVVIGKVLTCVPHPNADKLRLTTVDAGTGTVLNIVCGAPNVAAGQKVLVALIGTEIFLPDGSSFVIKEAKIRGELSQGMLCAEDELGMGQSHEGLLILPDDAVIGTLARDYFNIESDEIIDIGLTPNRADANSHFGVARDLYAALRFHKLYDGDLHVPPQNCTVGNGESGFKVSILNQASCPHYTGLVIENIKVGESPEWLKKRLQSIGQRPLNNIVDITNYVMHELGQPLHAFDADKIAGQHVQIMNLPTGTLFKSLDEVERKLDGEDLMICDGNGQPMCIAGVFGGIDSGVTEQTTRIFLESAYFAPTSIRRSSFRHNLRTESAAHFEKGTDPNQCLTSLLRAAYLMQDLAGGIVKGSIIDVYPDPVSRAVVTFRPQKARAFIGKEIPDQEMIDIFELLGMDVSNTNSNDWQVTVSGHKTDVTREADLIEEIVRIYGLNHIPAAEKISFSMTGGDLETNLALKNKASAFLTNSGFFEAMSLSIINGNQWSRVSGLASEEGVRINNTSNVQLDLMRPDPMASALESVAYNHSRQQPDLKMYEFGRVYNKNIDGEYIEQEFLSIFGTGRLWEESWQTTNVSFNAYYLKSLTINLLENLGMGKYQIIHEVSDVRFDNAIDISAKGQTIARIGQISKSWLKNAGIKSEAFLAHIYWDQIQMFLEGNQKIFKEFSRFPVVRRDLAVVLDESVAFENVKKSAKKAAGEYLDKIILFDRYKNDDQIGVGKHSLSLGFFFINREKTFTDQEIDSIMNKLVTEFESKLKGIIRK